MIGSDYEYKRCEGAKLVQEIFDFDPSKYFSYAGVALNATSIARPCGLHAKSYPRDQYKLFFNDVEIPISH